VPLLDTGNARAELGLLRDAGVHIALDDYGTGFSGLGRLLQLPLTALKLDRSIVAGIGDNERSIALAKSTFTLAADMGIEVICEGVESEEQRSALLSMDGQYAQGWLFGRPMQHCSVAAHLRRQTTEPAYC
jgi:EAL domain-containing protein (putative c-di-GMP-specific phosphodiesterase class I)